MQNSQREDYGYQKGNDASKSGIFGNLNKSQKITASSLAVFAFFILIFWALQFQKTLITPFTISNNQEDTETTATGNNTDNQDMALKDKDTDKDGLNDWEELNKYKTSAYLSDSDSDGYDDKIEIDNSKDPNCPMNQDCSVAIFEDVDTSAISSGTTSADALPGYLQEAIESQMIQEQSSQNAQANTTNLSDSELLNQIMDGTINPATLRQLLMDKGLKKEVLDKISDEQLLANMKESLKSNAASAGNSTNSTQ
jgi:hypothetical protein